MSHITCEGRVARFWGSSMNESCHIWMSRVTYEWVIMSHLLVELEPKCVHDKQPMIHSNVWQDLFICVTGLIHTCDKTHAYVWQDAFICVTGLIHMCDRTLSHVWQDSFICVTRLFHVWTGLFHVICVRMWLRPCSVSQMPIQDPAVPCPWFWTVRYPKGNEMINTHQASSVWKNGRPGAVERPYPHTPVAAHFDRVPEFE